MNLCNQRHQCNLWLRTLLHQLMTGQVRVKDMDIDKNEVLQ